MKTGKVLFVHGLNGDSNSSTGAISREFFEKRGHQVEIPTFDELKPQETWERIKKYCADQSFEYIVGHSLGGFYVAAAHCDKIRIVINPCLYPSAELPKFFSAEANDLVRKLKAIDQEKTQAMPQQFDKLLAGFKLVERAMESEGTAETKSKVYGIFGECDPLFSYKKEFGRIFEASHIVSVQDGEHKLTAPQVQGALQQLFALHKI